MQILFLSIHAPIINILIIFDFPFEGWKFLKYMLLLVLTLLSYAFLIFADLKKFFY